MSLLCGEALGDLFVAEAGQEGELPARAIAGGSPTNVAVGLARLRAQAGFFGGINIDAFGRFPMQRLSAEGVGAGLVKRSPAPTPLVVVANGPDGQPGYAFHASGCAYAALTAGDLPGHLPQVVAALALGSFSHAAEPAGSTLLTLAKREAGRVVIGLDPNVRPAPTDDMAAWRSRFARFARTATLIKLSTEDVALGWGPQADAAALAAEWLSGGTAMVVVTRGADGATAHHACGMVRKPGRAVIVAGTFHAAPLAWLGQADAIGCSRVAGLDRAGLQQMLRYAVLVASIACTRPGANLPQATDLLAAQIATKA